MRSRDNVLFALVMLTWMLAGCIAPIERMPTPTGLFHGSGLPTAAPQSTPQPALLERRYLILEWPLTLREKDSDLIVLTIALDENGTLTPTVEMQGQSSDGTPIDIPNIYDTHTLLAVARLDLAGMEAYRENIREPLLPGKPAVFRWSIRANEAGTYRGVVWLHLEMAPKAGGAVNEMLLMASPIEIQTITLLGLPGNLARILAGVGLVASTLLGYPFIQRWFERWTEKKKRAKR